jgi:hypothetical protein
MNLRIPLDSAVLFRHFYRDCNKKSARFRTAGVIGPCGLIKYPAASCGESDPLRLNMAVSAGASDNS